MQFDVRKFFATLVIAGGLTAAAGAEPVTLVADGEPQMRIIAGSVEGPEDDPTPGDAHRGELVYDPVERLREVIGQMSGAELEVADAEEGADGIYVGTLSDFPWLELEGTDDLGTQGFIIRSDGTNLYLVGEEALGVQHAVTTFVTKLGYRRYFPGENWTIIPELATIEGDWDERQAPAFHRQRRIWYGHSSYGKNLRDFALWIGDNRTGGPEPINIGHTWYGLDRETDFERNPEWFALVEQEDGTMLRRNTKPCFSHPEVIQQMIDHTRRSAEAGAKSISLSPADGINYCECDRCKEVFQGGEPYRGAHLTIFAERPDGVTVNMTTENLFTAINKVAAAIEDDYPDLILGTYAYSNYAHPPSFDLHPQIYIQTTTAMRDTPLSFDEQMRAWAARAHEVGTRDFWSVYQSDWDDPQLTAIGTRELKMRPDVLADHVRTYHYEYNVVGLNTEMSNNWAPRGLSYYVGANLLWDPDVDVPELIQNFYENAFGPAADVMQQYYVRWYGPGAQVLETDREMPDNDTWTERDLDGSRQTLAAMFAELDEAGALLEDHPEHLKRIEDLKMYAYFLWLRLNYWDAVAAEDNYAILDAIRDKVIFKGKLADTNMVHSRALLHQRFERRYRPHEALWEDRPEAERSGEWRQTRERPSSEEFAELWAVAREDLGLN